MQAMTELAVAALAAQRYDALYLGFAGAIVGCLKRSELLTTVLCKEIDGLLRRVCEAAHQNGYCVVVVGTDGFATHVPLREADSFPVVNVPCVVLPAEGQKLRRCEGRRVGAVRCSGAPVGGERGRDLPAPGGRGAEGLHGAFAGRRRGEWRAGESSLRDLECLFETKGGCDWDLECCVSGKLIGVTK